MDGLKNYWCCDAPAVLTQEVKGKFSTFAAGESVKVKWNDGITCLIERANWNGALPIMNQLAGVPRYFLKF